MKRMSLLLRALLVWLLVSSVVCTGETTAAERPRTLIGYTEFRSDLPGGRHANVATMRAVVARADGTERRLVAQELTREPDSWSQFAGWSPDGALAIVGRGWDSPENGRWEEEHKEFRYSAAGWLFDMILVDLANNHATNVTALDRVSFHNSGLFFWPNNSKRLGFLAIIDGNSHRSLERSTELKPGRAAMWTHWQPKSPD
jgi:hypothetical protein